MKDERDDRDRKENGTNGDERKGNCEPLVSHRDGCSKQVANTLAAESPLPAHDDLDVAE